MNIYRCNKTGELCTIEFVNGGFAKVLGKWYEARNYYTKSPLTNKRGTQLRQFTLEELEKEFTLVAKE